MDSLRILFLIFRNFLLNLVRPIKSASSTVLLCFSGFYLDTSFTSVLIFRAHVLVRHGVVIPAGIEGLVIELIVKVLGLFAVCTIWGKINVIGISVLTLTIALLLSISGLVIALCITFDDLTFGVIFFVVFATIVGHPFFLVITFSSSLPLAKIISRINVTWLTFHSLFLFIRNCSVTHII